MGRLRSAVFLVVCLSCRDDAHHVAPVGSASAAPSASASSAPDVTTHASTTNVPDAAAAVANGVLDGDALRKKHLARVAADDSSVTILAGSSARELGRRICEAKVPHVAAATPILLKPNMGGFEWFKDPKKSDGDDGVRGRTTDPEFVRGVVECLKARGHTQVTIAEGWAARHEDWLKLIRVSGYEAMAQAEGVPLVAMDDDGVFDKEGETPGAMLRVSGMEKTHVPTLLSPKILADTLQRGLFISLPKIKAHRFAVFSLAIKGTQGTVALSDASPAFHQKWRMHKELIPYLEARTKNAPENRAEYVKSLEIFAERIADVLEINTPDVVLAEGAPAMQGDGFAKLYPMQARVAIGGTNVVQVDRIGAEFLGAFGRADLAKELGGHSTSPLLEVAAKRFGVDLSKRPTVDGDGAALLDVRRPYHFAAMAPFSIDVDLPHPEAHAASLGADTITIDGRGDEPAWSRATPIRWDSDFAGRATGKTTRARFLWSPSALYALFEVDGTTATQRAPIYRGDCVEAFLAPNVYARHYDEIELGPRGGELDVRIDRLSRAGDTTWKSGTETKAIVDEAAHRVVIEARIPARDVVAALHAGAILRMGLFRVEGSAHLAWSPPRTRSPDFHVFDAFGDLVVDR
ncbi:MAG TPA: DUF362 domain-containing protein [Polyangiaceae bacterium]|jgi:uncharacterized protein (DUF362 family)